MLLLLLALALSDRNISRDFVGYQFKGTWDPSLQPIDNLTTKGGNLQLLFDYDSQDIFIL
jgi:hypothetical protein